MLENDDIATLQEYLGYLLIPSTRGQAMMSIIGSGGEGKSVLGTLINNIFGKSLISGELHRIEKDKYFRANLKDKLLFLDDDMQLEALTSTGTIKSLVTIEIPLDIEEKNKQSYTAKLYARLLCFGNGSPRALYDKTMGFARRMIILTTKQVNPNRKVNRNLSQELLGEKDGIFNWMFQGLQRLIANNYQFTLSERTRKNSQEMMRDNCNIISFLESDLVKFGEEFQVGSAWLHTTYSIWCNDNALTAMKKDGFTKWLILIVI